jgi:ABC-type transporter Mla maintaining outer membrane lipid asymmetry permease subunit MlaE
LVRLVSLVGRAGSVFFSVFVEHVTLGAFAAGMTLLTGRSEMSLAIVKRALFGSSATLIAQSRVAARALTTRSGADTTARYASSRARADIRESSDHLAGDHSPSLSTPLTSGVAEW